MKRIEYLYEKIAIEYETLEDGSEVHNIVDERLGLKFGCNSEGDALSFAFGLARALRA
jgi:hypothetical protein